MGGITPINSSHIGFSAITTGRSSDNSHAYIQSRINDLYHQALSRQQVTFCGTRSLKRFINSNDEEGNKLDRLF